MDQLVNIVSDLAPFLVAIVVVVIFHEFGHYFTARLCGLPVSEFSVGFGNPIWKRKDKNGTEWRFSPILLGGYVKIPDLLTLPGPKSAFENKINTPGENQTAGKIPVRKKFLTVAGGPLASFILAIIVFAFVVTFQGFIKEPIVVKTVHYLPINDFDLQAGDEILTINDYPINNLYDLYTFGNQADPTDIFYYRVMRFQEEVEVTGPYPTPPVIDNINLASPAEEAGLLVGDIVLSVDGRDIASGSDLAREVTESRGRLMDLAVFRDNQVIDIKLAGEFQDIPMGNGEFEKRILIGVGLGLALEPDTFTPGPLDALWHGALRTLSVVISTLEAIPKFKSG